MPRPKPSAPLDEVNAVLRAMMRPGDRRALELYRRPDNRLRLRVEGTAGFDHDPAIRPDGLWFANVSRRRFDCGGTEEQALVQIIRWHRGLPRRPLAYWWAITGPGINFGGLPLLNAVAGSSYFADPAMVACVRCGRPDPRDWWSLDGLTGPACRGVTSDGCPR